MGKRKALLGRVSDVDLRLLRIFQTVVNCGGFSAAEIDLGIGRSTISTHIGKLEARLGTRLCQRGRAGFALTGRGKKIYEASLGLMKSLDDFRNEVNADQDSMTLHRPSHREAAADGIASGRGKRGRVVSLERGA